AGPSIEQGRRSTVRRPRPARPTSPIIPRGNFTPMGEKTENTKPRLRRELEARRRGIAAEEFARAGASVHAHVAAMPDFRTARHVVLYAARPWEVDVRALEAAAHALGAATYFPRVEGDELVFRCAGSSELTPGHFGVPEPAGSSDRL